jgi:hypothetical protein
MNSRKGQQVIRSLPMPAKDRRPSTGQAVQWLSSQVVPAALLNPEVELIPTEEQPGPIAVHGIRLALVKALMREAGQRR